MMKKSEFFWIKTCMICKKGAKVKEVHYQFGNISVKLVDTSSNTERKKRLEKPLKDFFKEAERQRNEKKIKTKDTSDYRSSHVSMRDDLSVGR